MTNTAAELQPEVIELDTSRIYQFPKSPEPPNPILDAPVDYIPPPDAVLNREPEKPKRKRQGKGGRPKGSRNKKDIEAAAKRREEESAARAPSAAEAAPASTSNHVVGAATNASGREPVRFSRANVDTLLLILGAFVMFAAGGGAGYFLTGVGQ